MADSHHIVHQSKKVSIIELQMKCAKMLKLRSKPGSLEPKNRFLGFLAERALQKAEQTLDWYSATHHQVDPSMWLDPAHWPMATPGALLKMGGESVLLQALTQRVNIFS